MDLRSAGSADQRSADLYWIEEAVRSCPAAMAEFGGFYGRATTALAPLLGPHRELLILDDGTERLGFVDLETDGEVTNLTYFVAPDQRGQGLGTRALRRVAADRPDRRLVAAIAPDNAASITTALRAGFVETGRNEWGEGVFVFGPSL